VLCPIFSPLEGEIRDEGEVCRGAQLVALSVLCNSERSEESRFPLMSLREVPINQYDAAISPSLCHPG